MGDLDFYTIAITRRDFISWCTPTHKDPVIIWEMDYEAGLILLILLGAFCFVTGFLLKSYLNEKAEVDQK